MRAFAVSGDELQLGLADVGAELRPAVEALGFGGRGAVYTRSFPAGAPYAEAAAARFERCAEQMVRQAAQLEDTRWEEALALVIEREPRGWWLAGSAALAARGIGVAPRDVDLISDAAGCDHLAATLADVLVEPLVDGGRLGERWFRAFAGARIECVGGIAVSFDEESDVGRTAAGRLETIEWRGHELRVPPLDLQLHVAERRGLDERAELIREALQ
jgi:hypothetical protein